MHGVPSVIHSIGGVLQKPNAPSPTFFWAMGWCNANVLAPRRQLFKPRGASSSARYTGAKP